MNQKNINKNPYTPPAHQKLTSDSSWFGDAFETSVVIRAFYMAVIVGTILVLINHGMCIYSGKFGFTCIWQSALTYLVPYTVSTVSSVLATRKKQ